jgi:hypothetical protein
MEKEESQLKILRILWLSFVSMPLIFLVIVRRFPTGEWMDLVQLPPTGMAMAFAALMSAVLGVLIPRWLKSAPAAQKSPLLPPLVRFAFFESIATFGLVVCFATQKNIFLPFLILNLVMMFLFFPKRELL